MALSADPSNRAWSIWRSCLGSALRTALACTIVGCVTLYGPPPLRRLVAFPAFSYVTVILIVTDATLGDTVRGCWQALYASVQGVCPAILSLWVIGPARLSTSTTSLAVAISAFAVALPDSTQLCKRIALGQIVIVYVVGYIRGADTDAIMHPVHVAASTVVGVLACVLALLLPYPRLASYEVNQNCKLFLENASERLKHFVRAFCAEDRISAVASVSQAKSLAVAGNELLQSIKRKQESMQWEIPPFRFLKPYCMKPGDILQDTEIPLRGMDIALNTIPSFPAPILNQDLKDSLLKLEDRIDLTLRQIYNTSLPYDSSTAPESNAHNSATKSLQTLCSISPTHKDLPSLFFLFCFKLLQNGLIDAPSSNPSKQGLWRNWVVMKLNTKRFMPAFKCSLSLGLATLFGLIYSKKDGYWSGLPVAISLSLSREATFKVTNIKTQGTVLGTVYGLLGCFLFEQIPKFRLLSLLPWFILTSFLCRSRMYGPAGGISAVIGALLILGRINYGSPSEFAIARIVETFIGLSCTIIVEILLQRTRASTLAKVQLSESFATLNDCFASMNFRKGKAELETKRKAMKVTVCDLGKFIREAEVEPNFWFLPFHGDCYNKLSGSLLNVVDLLFFASQAIGFLEQDSKKVNGFWKEVVEKIDCDLDGFKELVSSSVKCFEEITSIKSLIKLEEQLQKNELSFDIELGKSRIKVFSRSYEQEVEKLVTSFLHKSREVVEKLHDVDDEREHKIQMILNLGALAFCITSLAKEMKEFEKGVRELVQWENPSSHVNLYEISSKIHTLYS